MATYKEIGDYIYQKYGVKTVTGWIAHMKEIHGLPLRHAHNRIDPNTRVRPCPKNKQYMLEDAFVHFGMIENEIKHEIQKRPISKIVLKNFMLEILGNEEFCEENSNGKNFIRDGGVIGNLFTLIEKYSIKLRLIEDENKIKESKASWLDNGETKYPSYNTNFTFIEIHRLWEIFHMFINNYIISPGLVNNSELLPFFHITEHGMECIQCKEVLPYDIDGYLNELNLIDDLDEWVRYYMTEAVRCFNANCFNATIMMIGLSSEKLVEELIKNFSILLGKKRYHYNHRDPYQLGGRTIKEFFDYKISKETKISKKYGEINEIYNKVVNLQPPIFNQLDRASQKTFTDFLRITRNEVVHPKEINKDETETMLMLIAFTKFCKLQMESISIIKSYF